MARNINISTPRFSRMGQQRLALFGGPARTGMAISTAPSPAPTTCSCEGAPSATQTPASTLAPAGVQLTADVPYYTMTPKSTLLALNYALRPGESFAIDAVDGAGQSVRLVTTSAPREDNVIEAWDTLRGFATNVRLVNLN